MPHILVKIFAILIFFVCLTPAHAENEQNTIHVVAEGKASAEPNEVALMLSFSATDFVAEKAHNTVDKQVMNLLAKLSHFELDTSSLDSSQTQIYPQYEHRNKQQQFLGYQLIRNVSFKLSDLRQLDELIETIAKSKISKLNQIRFGLSDPDSLKEQALADAIKHSKTLAQQIAESYGVTLDKISSVSHHSTAQHRPFRARAMSAELLTESHSSTYQQKDLEFKATIDVSFGFQ